MPLQAGDQLGPYRILGALGAGGMGEVYRARDTRLGRDVALKVLPEGLTAAPEARARFELEALAIASLNHPHICTIHDTGSEGGTGYLVLELIEGQSLRDVIAPGPLPLDSILSIGVDVADALEAAHAKGIVHRDLKPGNIMVTGRGAKVMDFGVAVMDRSREVVGAGPGETFTAGRITSTGTTVGSVAYMSPEQARGEPVDARSDLFSLGTVLYEMATAELPFPGITSAVIFDGILNREPAPLRSKRPDIPAEFERIVSKALEKDRDLRYQTASELRVDLRRLQRDSSRVETVPVTAQRSPRRPRTRTLEWSTLKWPGIALAIVLVAAGTWWIAGRSRTGASDRGTWVPHRVPFSERFQGDLALSPDGTKIASVSDSSLSVVSTDTNDSRVVDRLGAGEGTYVATEWLADGSGLVATRRDAVGNVTETIVDLITGRRTVLTGLGRLDADEATNLFPSLSPDGARVAFRRGYSASAGLFVQLWIKDVRTGAERMVVHAGSGEMILPAAWSPTGDQLAFVQAHGLQGSSELKTCDLGGRCTTVVVDSTSGLMPSTAGFRTLQWRNDRIIYARRPSRFGIHSEAELYSIRVDPGGRPAGSPQSLYALPGASLGFPSVSKDGRTLLVAASRDVQALRFCDIDGRSRYDELTSRASTSRLTHPVWSLDGRGVFGRSLAASARGVIGYVRLADGAFERLLTEESVEDRPLCLTPDGQELLCFLGSRIVAEPVGGGAPRPIGPRFDGLVFCAAKAGRCVAAERVGDTLVVRDFSPATGRGAVRFRVPFGGLKSQFSITADLSRDGSRLAVLGSDPGECSILDASSGRELSHIKFPSRSLAQDLVWSPDGRALYASGMLGPAQFWIARLGDHRLDRLIWSSDTVWPGMPAVSPDGSTLAFFSREFQNEVWAIQRQ